MTLFTDDQLQKIIDETLPDDAKPGEKVVVATVDKDGAKVVASFQLKQHWELQAAAKHSWSGDDSAAAKVILRW